MDTTGPDPAVLSLIAGEPAAGDTLRGLAPTSRDAATLVAAALVTADGALLTRAGAVARDAAQRRLVAVAAAHLARQDDRCLLLARDHLADHPDDVLVAHIAARTTARRTDTQEKTP